MSATYSQSKGEAYVTIPEEEYRELLDQAARYEALCAGGVDNWEGYSWSLQEYYMNPDDEEDEGKE